MFSGIIVLFSDAFLWDFRQVIFHFLLADGYFIVLVGFRWKYGLFVTYILVGRKEWYRYKYRKKKDGFFYFFFRVRYSTFILIYTIGGFFLFLFWGRRVFSFGTIWVIRKDFRPPPPTG